METTITITTINKPEFLGGLCKNISEYGHKDTDIVIIGDIKTPPIEYFCKGIGNWYGVPIEYLDIDKQEKTIPKPLLDMFAYNTPDRTILGGMLSYLRGSQLIIAIDDDNYVTDADFVGWHSDVGKVKNRQLIQTDTGWFNVHESLESDIEFYPRGYPFGQRYKKVKGKILYQEKRAVVNQGLVLGDPDIDAMQRLIHPINALKMKPPAPESNRHLMRSSLRIDGKLEEQYGLYETWSPFNYQNTCLYRELIPCYFRPKSGLRNADIWTAYIFNKLANHMGDVITFGQPLVRQERNGHNLFDDLDVEIQNNRETDYFCELIGNTKLTKDYYWGALTELITLAILNLHTDYPMTRSFLEEYRVWLEVVDKLL